MPFSLRLLVFKSLTALSICIMKCRGLLQCCRLLACRWSGWQETGVASFLGSSPNPKKACFQGCWAVAAQICCSRLHCMASTLVLCHTASQPEACHAETPQPDHAGCQLNSRSAQAACLRDMRHLPTHLFINGVQQDVLGLEGLPHGLPDSLEGAQPLFDVVQMLVLLILGWLSILQQAGVWC